MSAMPISMAAAPTAKFRTHPAPSCASTSAIEPTIAPTPRSTITGSRTDRETLIAAAPSAPPIGVLPSGDDRSDVVARGVAAPHEHGHPGARLADLRDRVKTSFPWSVQIDESHHMVSIEDGRAQFRMLAASTGHWLAAGGFGKRHLLLSGAPGSDIGECELARVAFTFETYPATAQSDPPRT
jgi:hypothetical protein